MEPLPPVTTYAALESHAEGLVCLSGCARHGALARALEAGRHAEAATAARRLLAIFGRDATRIELQRPFARHDRRRNRLLAQLAQRLQVLTVATGDVHAHSRARTRLQDAFVAVRLGRALDECEPKRRGNSSHALAPPEAMAARFAEHPDAVAETVRRGCSSIRGGQAGRWGSLCRSTDCSGAQQRLSWIGSRGAVLHR